MSIGKHFLLLVMVLFLSACNLENLAPSDEDRRDSSVELAEDFTLYDIFGNSFSLSDYLVGGATAADAVVLYFTMWCPTCTSHTSHLYNEIVPTFEGRGTVEYVLVDYVSGDWQNSYWTAQANGYAATSLTIVADVDQVVKNSYHGSMGVTVVINPQGEIVMKEDYRSGANLEAALDGLLPP